MTIKQWIVRIALIIECSALTWAYFFGVNGLGVIFAKQRDIYQIELSVAQAQKVLDEKEHELQQLQEDDFFVEQYAREKLAMARDDDEIYLIK